MKGDCDHADHLPVRHRVQLLPAGPKRSSYKINSFYLKDPMVQAGVKRIWRQNYRLGFTGKLRRVVKFYRTFGVQKSTEQKAAELALRQQLEALRATLHGDPHNPIVQDSISEVGDLLSAFEQHVVEGQRARSRVKWKRVGDSCSQEFLKALKAHTGASDLTALEEEHGLLRSDQAGLEDVCSKYYGKLYKEPLRSAAQEGVAARTLAYLEDWLSQAMEQSLSTPISLDELGLALKDMDSGKAPGPDGVITEFFKHYWDLIKVDYFLMITVAVEQQRLPPGVTRGLISLLHKGEARCRLTNWCLSHC